MTLRDDPLIEKSGGADQRYGLELILDLHGCNPSTFNRESISKYFKRLCDLIDMKPGSSLTGSNFAKFSLPAC